MLTTKEELQQLQEATALKIAYWRFGGNKPYKVIPGNSSYVEASSRCPRFRTKEQAVKYLKMEATK